MSENVFATLPVDKLLGLLERAGRGPNLDLIRAILAQGEIAGLACSARGSAGRWCG